MSTTVVRTPPVRAERTSPAGVRARRRLLPYALLLPGLLALCAGLGYPLVRQVVLSLQGYGLAQQFGRPAEWVGLDNYAEVLSDPYLWLVVLRSIVFCLACAGITMLIGTLLALAMRLMSKPVRLIVQTGLLLAWAMPALATLTVWQWLFDSQYGVVNWLLEQGGLDFAGHSWLIEPLSFFFVAGLVVVWMSVPFVAFTIYAGLTQLPLDVIEAAEVDGATPWQRLRHVIIPLTRPLLLIVGLLQIIWDLRVFTQIYVLQNAGGVTRETNLLGTYIYRSGIGEGNFGIASAVAVFMLALTVVLTFPYVARMIKDADS